MENMVDYSYDILSHLVDEVENFRASEAQRATRVNDLETRVSLLSQQPHQNNTSNSLQSITLSRHLSGRSRNLMGRNNVRASVRCRSGSRQSIVLRRVGGGKLPPSRMMHKKASSYGFRRQASKDEFEYEDDYDNKDETMGATTTEYDMDADCMDQEDEIIWTLEELYELPEDVFTMMFFAEPRSASFIFGLSIFISQLLILSVITIDLLGDDELREGEADSNRIQVPLNVNWQVRIAQILAILISVVSRDDCTDTFKIVSIGFKRRWSRLFKGATVPQFVMMNVMRFSQGAFVIIVSFLFILQSDNVLDLFLNFAAMEFVAGLDNLAYQLASQGWVTRSMQKLTADINDNHKLVLTDKDKAKLQNQPFLRHILCFLMLAALYSGLFKNFMADYTGELLRGSTCGDVEVYFGDEVFVFSKNSFEGFQLEDENCASGRCKLKGSDRPLGPQFSTTEFSDMPLEYFSAKYTAYFGRADRMNQRPVYYEEAFKDPTSGKFYYCEAEKAWVFTVKALADSNALLKSTKDRCGEDGWLLRSPVTTAHALDEVPSEGWKIWTDSSLQDVEELSIICAGCSSDIDCGVTRGSCVNQFCECEKGFTGNFCEEKDPCRELAFYSFKLTDTISHSSPYINVNNRPVYSSLPGPPAPEPPPDTDIEAILYTGRRWIKSNIKSQDFFLFFEAAKTAPRPGEVADVTNYDFESFSSLFHLYWAGLQMDLAEVVSQPTKQRSPVGEIRWTRLLSSHSIGSYTQFGAVAGTEKIQYECLRVDCTIPRVCGLHATCQMVPEIKILGNTIETGFAGGQCVCDGTYTGHFCEYGNLVSLDPKNEIVAGPYEIDPFGAACVGPHANLPFCKQIFYK